ncbi:hypothetical protein ACTJKT_28445 [Pseudomonas sp. 22526]|uniref:hypothetical protein n=1 Tax=Pseudomonas sp. 22526 TaxID=3453937 RepID=UPI003F857FCE
MSLSLLSRNVMKNHLAMSVTLAGCLSLFSAHSHAGISLDSTRAVLAGPKKEASILALNFAIEGAASLVPGGTTRIEFESIDNKGMPVQHSSNISI